MTKVQALVNEIKRAARVLDVDPDSFDIHTSTSERDFPITVMGHEWGSLPIGEVSRSTSIIADYLQNEGWEMTDADRSGVYLTKNDIVVRFC